MSSKFKPLTDDFYVAPQLTEEDIAEAKALGIGLIIANRPDREEAGQPRHDDLAKVAKEHGIRFERIPVDQRGVSRHHIDHFKSVVADYTGKTLAFCRSGTRSTILRAFVRASEGDDINGLVREAMAAGYDLFTLVPGLEAVSPKTQPGAKRKPR
ncbi:MAG: TIGR01244 family sulfur transferase [Pseudomonadota bacterium]